MAMANLQLQFVICQAAGTAVSGCLTGTSDMRSSCHYHELSVYVFRNTAIRQLPKSLQWLHYNHFITTWGYVWLNLPKFSSRAH